MKTGPGTVEACWRYDFILPAAFEGERYHHHFTGREMQFWKGRQAGPRLCSLLWWRKKLIFFVVASLCFFGSWGGSAGCGGCVEFWAQLILMVTTIVRLLEWEGWCGSRGRGWVMSFVTLTKGCSRWTQALPAEGTSLPSCTRQWMQVRNWV